MNLQFNVLLFTGFFLLSLFGTGCSGRPERQDIYAAPAHVQASSCGDELCESAKLRLEQNVLNPLRKGSHIGRGVATDTASIDTREFCLSTPGLLKLGHDDVVKNQLENLLNSENQTADAHKLNSVDTNVLLLLAAADYAEFLELQKPNQGKVWARSHKASFLKLLAAYDKLHGTDADAFSGALQPSVPALILQPLPMAAGVDGREKKNYNRIGTKAKAAPEGYVLLTNMIYFLSISKMQNFEILTRSEWLPALRAEIEQTFKDPQSSLYFSVRSGPEWQKKWNDKQFSLDGMLLGLDQNFWSGSEAQDLYLKLRASHAFQSLLTLTPGKANVIEVDQTYDHAWILGLGIKVAKKFQDQQTVDNLYGALKRTTAVSGAGGELIVDALMAPTPTASPRL